MGVDPDRPPQVDELLEHVDFVRMLAGRLLSEDAHGAEDLAQDVWAAALERPPHARSRVKGWFRSVARNLNASRMRRLEPRLEGEALTESPAELPSAADQAEIDEARATVARAVRSLREPYRGVLFLRFYEGLPPREVARRLARPVETVHTQVKRGLALLRTDLESQRGRGGSRTLLGLALLPRSTPRPVLLPAATAAIVLSTASVLFVVFADGRTVRAEEAAPAEQSLTASLEPEGPRREPSELARSPVEAPPPVEALIAEISPPAGPTLEVRVVDARGALVEGASVFVASADGWALRGTTRVDGLARIELDRERELGVGSNPGSLVHLFARAPGLATIKESMFDLADEESAQLSVALGGPAAELSARIVDPDGFGIDGADVVVLPANIPTGTSSAGVMLRAARHLSRTDEDGVFELAHLPGESMQVHMRHPDLGVCSVGVELAPGARVRTELTFTPGGVIAGTVVDEHGVAVEGATIRTVWPGPVALPSEWIHTVTDADGRYTLAVPASPNTELWVRGPGGTGRQCCERVDVRSGEWLEQELVVRTWPPVRVRLLDAKREPLSGWLLSLRPMDAGDVRYTAGLTDAQGRTEMILPFEGKLRVDVLGELLDRTESILHSLEGLVPDPLIEHEVVIDTRGSLRARVHGLIVASGWAPPDDLMVVFEHRPTGNSVRVPVASDLTFQADTLGPGHYLARVHGGESLKLLLTELELQPGETLDLGALELPHPALLDLSRVPPDVALTVLAPQAGGLPTQVWRGTGGRPEPVLLMPGSYALQTRSTQGAQAQALFEVASGADLFVTAELEVR